MEENEIPQQNTEAARGQEVLNFAAIYGERALAENLMLERATVTVDDVRAAIKQKREAASKNQPAPEAPAAAAERANNAQPAVICSRATLKAFRGENAQTNAHRAGHFLRAALFGNQKSQEFCRANGISVERAHSESNNSDGGFLVIPEIENTIIDLRLEYGVFRRNANVVPMASSEKSRPRRKGGLTAYPIGAAGASRRLTESKKGWDRVGLNAKKWGVLAKYEEELSDDAVISMADDLTSEIAYAFAKIEDECGFYGDGTSNYHGITGVIEKLNGLHATKSNIAGIQVASGNVWSEITQYDLLALVGRLPSFARKAGSVKWYCANEFFYSVLVRIALSLGGNNAANIQGAQGEMFLGKPVEIVETMPHSEANSQIPLLYGNLAQAAMFGDRRGVTVKMTDSNDTDFEEDLMAIKGTERFDINVHDVGNASSTASQRLAGPIVGLMTASS